MQDISGKNGDGRSTTGFVVTIMGAASHWVSQIQETYHVVYDSYES